MIIYYVVYGGLRHIIYAGAKFPLFDIIIVMSYNYSYSRSL